MALAPKTVKTYALNGSLKDFAIPFEYLARKFVTVTLIGATRRELVLNTDFRFSTSTQITTLRGSAWGPADNYDLIEIRRFTSATERLVDFADGSILRAYDLNTSQIQSLHIAEEARDLTADTIGVNNDGNLDARARRIVNLADPVDPGDAVTLRFEQQWASSTLNSKIAAESARDATFVARDLSLGYRDTSFTYQSNALTYSNTALSARDAAIAARDLAQLWATKEEDSTVSGGAYSALHWAAKAAAQATLATTQANNSANSASASQTSRLASEAARDLALTYRDDASASASAAASSAAGVSLPSAAGQALKVLRQNASATGFEYVAPMVPIRATMVGTVSQSAGVPTGAIVERGANAQGAYVRYADGTQICWLEISTGAVNQINANVANSLAVVPGAFPATFSAAPVVTGSASPYGAAQGVFWAGMFVAPTQTSWGSWLGMAPATTSAFSTLRLMAVGRWY